MERILNGKQMKAVVGCFFICLFTFSLFAKNNNLQSSFHENHISCPVLSISSGDSETTPYIEKTQSCTFQPKSSVKSSNLLLFFYSLIIKLKIKQPDFVLKSALKISFPRLTKFLLSTIQYATLF